MAMPGQAGCSRVSKSALGPLQESGERLIWSQHASLDHHTPTQHVTALGSRPGNLGRYGLSGSWPARESMPERQAIIGPRGKY